MNICLFQELRGHTAVDMPPEAILQRPSVVQHVLALLRPADKASSLPTLALHFLLCLIRRIKQTLGMALDPELVPAASGVYGNYLPRAHKPAMQAPFQLHTRSVDKWFGRKLHSLLHSWFHGS